MSFKQPAPYKKRRVLIDKKYSLIVYLATVVLAVICRISQLRTNMDFHTGKYIDPSPFKNTTMMVIIIGFILIIAVMIFGEARDKTIKSCVLINPLRLSVDKLNEKMSPKSAAAMFIMGALLAFDSLFPIIMTVNQNLDLSTESNPVPAFSGISLMEWILYGFMLILIVTFILTGVNIVKGDGITGGNCFFLAFFPIYKLVHIFVFIGKHQLIGPYSEKCYILFTDIFSSLFFLYLIRFFAGFEKKHTRMLMIISGYMASIIAAVSVVPRYIMYFIMDYSTREGMLSPELADVGVVFVTIAVIMVFWSNYSYREMPKLSIEGQRRWTNFQTEGYGNNEMESIDEE